jgi:hypothetical protein
MKGGVAGVAESGRYSGAQNSSASSSLGEAETACICYVPILLVVGAVGKASRLAPSSHVSRDGSLTSSIPDWDRTLNRYDGLLTGMASVDD